MVEELFWESSIEELTRGYKTVENGEEHVCLICGRSYRQGVIYREEEQLMEASHACGEHVRSTHGGMFHYLAGLNKKLTGLTELQAQVLGLFYDGASDGEIAEKLESSATTIRHHRFKLREREKQARVFLALMQLWKEEERKETEQWVAPHRGATMIDDRYQVTDVQRDKILANYFPQGIDGPLKTFPAKEKRKLVVLRALTERFERNRSYTEREVNDILGEAYHDQVTLRRYLIEYGFMTRTRDGSSYRLT
jgi:DNA-binding CsgD family transcriptional regulator